MHDKWWLYDTRGLIWSKFPDFFLTVEKHPPRKPQPGNWSDRRSSPGPLDERQRCHLLTQQLSIYKFIHCFFESPPLWARRQHARLSRSGPGFDPRSGQVSWVRFFRGFSSPVRQMSGSFRPPRSPNIIWPSLSSILIPYGRLWPEMLTRPKTYNIHTYFFENVSISYLDDIWFFKVINCFCTFSRRVYFLYWVIENL